MDMRAAVIVCFFASIACGKAGAPRPDTDELEIGLGHLDGQPGFIELADGMDATLRPGAQGGFHVFMNIRVDEVDMNPSRQLYIARDARLERTGQLVSRTPPTRSAFVPSTEPGYFDTAGPFRMFLCPTPIGIPVRDEMLVLTIRALDDSTDEVSKAEGTIRLRPHCPEDTLEFCMRICSG